MRIRQIFPSLGDEQIGIDIVKRALEEPLWLIATNTGHEGAVMVEKVRNNNAHFGFNGQSETYADLVDGVVIDPTKVRGSRGPRQPPAPSLFVLTFRPQSLPPGRDRVASLARRVRGLLRRLPPHEWFLPPFAVGPQRHIVTPLGGQIVPSRLSTPSTCPTNC